MTVFRWLAIVLSGISALGAGEVHAALPLQSIVLGVTNLRPGYSVVTSTYRTQAFMARQFGVRAGQLTYYGWTSSYEALYVRHDANGLGEVGNKIDRYSSPAGAHWGYRVVVHNALCCGKYHTTAMPRVGDESTAFLASTGARGFIGIRFRQGAYVGSMAVLPGTKRASLLLLARILDQRIRAYG